MRQFLEPSVSFCNFVSDPLHFSVAFPGVLLASLLFSCRLCNFWDLSSASFGAPAREHAAFCSISRSSCCHFSFLLHQRLFHIGEFFEVSQLFLQLFLSLTQLFLDVNFFIHFHFPVFFKPAFFTCWLALNPLLLLCILEPLKLSTNLCLRDPGTFDSLLHLMKRILPGHPPAFAETACLYFPCIPRGNTRIARFLATSQSVSVRFAPVLAATFSFCFLFV